MLPAGDSVTVVLEVSDALGSSAKARVEGVSVLTNNNTSVLAAAAAALNSSTASADDVLSSLLQVSAAAGGILQGLLAGVCAISTISTVV
jgi:hypothetical protein